MSVKTVIASLIILIFFSLVGVFFYLMGTSRSGLAMGIPSLADIFSPIILSQYYKQADGSKVFYASRLNEFANGFQPIMNGNSSFVKTAEADYTIGGTVVKISPITNQSLIYGNILGYDFLIKNSTSTSFDLKITPAEAQYAQVSLRNLSSGGYSKDAGNLSDVKPGDYLVVKRSINLLNSSETNLDVEILRTSN